MELINNAQNKLRIKKDNKEIEFNECDGDHWQEILKTLQDLEERIKKLEEK